MNQADLFRETPTLTAPTVHLNGTSREALLDQIRKAQRAMRSAIDALVEMSPNGRDYYVQGPDALGKAIAEHRARLQRCNDVGDELDYLLAAVHDQGRR